MHQLYPLGLRTINAHEAASILSIVRDQSVIDASIMFLFISSLIIIPPRLKATTMRQDLDEEIFLSCFPQHVWAFPTRVIHYPRLCGEDAFQLSMYDCFFKNCSHESCLFNVLTRSLK